MSRYRVAAPSSRLHRDGADPPILLKLGSTGYRFLRYYAGDFAYRLERPPALPLRLMAPALEASFIAWLALMSVHVLAHLGGSPRLALADWRRDPVPKSAARPAARIGAIAASLLAGCVLAPLTLRGLSPWP